MKSLVSIIIPCYNAERWIGECIDSALAQTYNSIEVIVVDDGSTDNSVSVLREYGDKIRWISCENGGPSAARNIGLKLSKGKYIQFIDSDDYINLAKIKEQVEFLEASNSDVIYGDWCYQYHQADGLVKLANYTTHQPTEDILYYIIACNRIIHGSCLYKREIFDKIVGFDESLRIAEDYYFSMRIALEGFKFSYQPGCHYFYRIYGANTASHGQGVKYPQSVELALDRASLTLEERGLLISKYSHALAYSYFYTAKVYLLLGESTAADICYHKCEKISPNQKFSPDKNSKFEKIYKLFGWEVTSKLVRLLNILRAKTISA
jgi:glycosyltransferase involved in cell wall biosynthesis